MSEFTVGPRELGLLNSYKKMIGNTGGMSPDALRGKMKLAEEKRLIALDPNKSKFMTEEEKRFALNEPDRLLWATGGFKATTGGVQSGAESEEEETEPEKRVRKPTVFGKKGTMPEGQAMTRATTSRLDSHDWSMG
jgi:hypothetical protein